MIGRENYVVSLHRGLKAGVMKESYDYRRTNKKFVLSVLLIVYTLNFVDRQILSLLIEPIKEDLSLSDSQLGMLTGIAFALFYSTLGIPIARWADRGSRVNIISISLALWSVMTALCGFAGSYWQLLLARIGVGVGEAGCTPPAHSLIADYFAREERPAALSVYMMGVPLGILAGYLIGGYVNEWFGWRVALFVLGVPGVVMALIVRLTVSEPVRGAKDGVLVGCQTPPLNQVFRKLWMKKSLRHLIIAMALTAFMGYGMGQWQPAFFIRSHSMTTGELGVYLAFIVGIGGGLGVYIGGWLASKLGSKNERRQLWVLSLSIALTLPFSVLVYLWPNKVGALWLLVPTNVLYFIWHGPAYALIQTSVDSHMRATAAAAALLLVNLIGLGLGPLLIGILSDLLTPYFQRDSLRVALLVNSFVAPWAAFHFFLSASYVVKDIDSQSIVLGSEVIDD